MEKSNDFVRKEDYQEPCCPLNMDLSAPPIPIGRVIGKLDEFLSRNDYESAIRLLKYWYDEAVSVGDSRGKLTVLNEQVGLYRKTGKEKECLSAIDEVLTLCKNDEFAGTVTVGTTYLNCATGYCAFKQFEKALPLYENAALIYEEKLNGNDAKLGGLYNNFGICLMSLKKFSEAEILFDKALKIMSGVENGQAEEAVTYCNMADLVCAEKGIEDGEEKINAYLEKAMSLLNTETLPKDGNYAFVCEKCAGTFGYYGYFLYERELSKRAREIYERT